MTEEGDIGVRYSEEVGRLYQIRTEIALITILIYWNCLLEQYSRSHDHGLAESIFHLLDTNNDGFLSKEEIQASFIVKMAKNEALAAYVILKLADLDDDGLLGLEEFTKLMVEESGM